MDWRSDPLWNALAAMRIEPAGASLSFPARLAREQGWTIARAEAVMAEYRRFLYLAATGDAPVTPSKAVDAAWHLHLTYSRHYWDVLCARTLGRPLHHDPTEGGAAQAELHRRQYARTLARYRSVFGIAPPPEIWPDIERRAPRRIGRTAALAVATLPIAACSALAANAGTVIVTILAWLLLLIPFAALLVWCRPGRDRDGSCAGGFGCSGGADGGSHGGHGCGGHGCGGGCGGH